MDEKTIQRIKKLQALAERGVGGEKTTAQKKLAKLLKDNGINSLDELQKEEYEYTIFSYNGKHEIKLLRQCMYKVMGAKSDRTAYKPYGRRQKIGIYCTKAQKIEIELEFEFYRNVFYEELSTFMDAFIQAQKIFPEDAPVEKLESTGMILALVTRTAYKGGVSIPVSTVKPTATWVNEGAGSDKQKKNIAKDGMITFAYHKLRCAVAVSLEVDTMAISAFETLLINNIVEAMTKALEQAIIDGNGTGKPKGILAEIPADGQTIESAAPSYSDLIKAEGALPMAYENGAVWCMSKKTFMEYVGMTDKNGQPIAKVNYGTSGKPERTLLGRTVVLCDYVASYSAALAKDTIFAFLFNFKDYVLNTNYSMGVKKYEDNDTDDQITKGIMLVDGKVVDKNSLVVTV